MRNVTSKNESVNLCNDISDGMHHVTFIFRPYPQFLPAGAREWLVLRLLYVFRVCLSVCVSALITCAIFYIIRYYATAVYSSFWRFAGQAIANEGSFVLPRWRKHGK